MNFLFFYFALSIKSESPIITLIVHLELSQSLCNTRAATSQLLDLRTKHQEELSDDPELKEAVDNLLKQVANFHRTCIEQLEK